MQKKIICPICGAQFETSRPNKKYCSFTCKAAGAKVKRIKWENENPDYIKNYMKQYRKNKGESKK